MIIFLKKFGSIVYLEIYEVDFYYIFKFILFELIKISCNFFGLSYEGCKEGIKYLIGVIYKLFIIIDLVIFIYVFLIVVFSLIECIWIFL